MIRPFHTADASEVNRIAVVAFTEHQSSYPEWLGLRDRLAHMADHAAEAEILVAETAGEVAGAVIYVAPHRPRPHHFELDWAIIRMLVVDLRHRGLGIGTALTAACIGCAIRDNAEVIALHTSPMMQAAREIYARSGFQLIREAPTNFGAPCSILAKRIAR